MITKSYRPHRLRIYVPIKCFRDHRVQAAQAKLNEEVGGYTVYPADGVWKGKKQWVSEKVYILEYLTDGLTMFNRHRVLGMVKAMLQAGEKCVLLTTESPDGKIMAKEYTK